MLKLVKTVGGENGAPKTCTHCRGKNFIASGMSWYCGDCKTYLATSFTDLKKNLDKLQLLHGQIKDMINGLERLVKK